MIYEFRYFKGLSGRGIFNRNSSGSISWHMVSCPMIWVANSLALL
jgi:hypothetical protein